MKRKHTIRFFSILTVLGIAIFFGSQANPETADNPGGFSMVEMTKLTKDALSNAEEYNGPQTVQALMEAFDETYNRNHLKTAVIIYRKTDGGTVSASVLTTSEVNLSHKIDSVGKKRHVSQFTNEEIDTQHQQIDWLKMRLNDGASIKLSGEGKINLSHIIDSVDGKRHVSQFTNEEIDARYPRAAWLQMLLDKGITIGHFGEYASYLSKRHTLAFLKDNPNLRNAVILDILPTDNWETYKAAYIDKLANEHAKLQKAAEQVERAKERVEHAQVVVEQAKERVENAKRLAEQAKAQAERVKNKFNSQQLENVKRQIEHLRKTLERLQKSMPPQEPNQKIKKKPSTIQI
ncbi:MAG: hypothetical protein OXI67_04825 [Candidatus Poribacteria bacterium]|nr:hypothetical protein [Candidatus Poribacteria bacterium]